MKRTGIAGLAILFGLCVGAQAIDRDATMIDTVALNLADQSDMDSIGATLWGETALADPDWAILFGGGYDELSPDNAHNIEAWTLGIGLKYYLFPLTSIAGVGTYTRYDQDYGQSDIRNRPDKDAKAVSVALKQRLLPADELVCPYAKGTLLWRHRSTFTEFPPDPEADSLSEVLLILGGGVEFEMRSNFTFVFEGGYVIADQSNDGGEDLDGFQGSVAMQYYFGLER